MDQAGAYTLKSFTIRSIYNQEETRPFDLTSVVYSFTIDESMDSSYIAGSAKIFESSNLVQSLPIRGEEIVDITFEDFLGNSYSYRFFVYAISDLENVKERESFMMSYTISFCSLQKLAIDHQYVRKSYGNALISDMVEDLYERFFTDLNGLGEAKELITQKTEGNQTLVIPKMRPDSAMDFLARKAYTSEDKSLLYFFFENRENFYFCTYEELVRRFNARISDSETAEKNRLKYIVASFNSNTAEGQISAQFSVSNLKYGARSNSIEAMKDGAYKRRLVELDYMNRTIIPRVFDYKESLEEFSVIDKLKLINSDEFVEEYMPDVDAPESYIVSDYNQQGLSQGKNNSLRPYPFYSEAITRKGLASYHLNKNAITCSISGNGLITAGSMIYLEVLNYSERSGAPIVDNERSGPYLVKSVSNVFVEDDYTQNLVLTKGGLGKERIT